jgi:tRNA threonylcarbamoyladenosine biosynthesis protein TsaE
MQVLLEDEAATARLGEQIGSALAAGDVVLLEGQLGAGKTFLARAIARALGVPPEVPVTSPTFALVHDLPARVPLLHADLYRLEDPDELVELGLLHRMGADAITVVEWGERFAWALGEPTLWVRLDVTGEHGRRAVLEAPGARGEQILAAIG